MSAETLRRAAALMRERAEAARAGHWYAIDADIQVDWAGGPRPVAHCVGSIRDGNAINAAHIASWHPAVALAVADLLDAARERHLASHIGSHGETRAALAVARAYLGESA